MLKLPALFVLALPLLVSAGIFPKDSHVKMLDPKSFKKVMKKDETSIVAFVAPWCGHCQKMAPEYAKAAKGLNPLVPAYAIDCDEEKNKPLCGEQGVKGFPTVKVFPRGNKVAPITYEGERTSSGFFDFTSRRIPNKNKKLYKVEEIKPWIEKTTSKPRALLLNKGKKMPLLWSVLAHKFEGKVDFATFFDMKGKGHKSLGYEWKEKSKLLLFAEDSSEIFEYDGLLKLEPLSEFFSNVLSGEQSL
ncbi:disulfide isomerase, partial [Flagelloscypha sp. PMI_526]